MLRFFAFHNQGKRKGAHPVSQGALKPRSAGTTYYSALSETWRPYFQAFKRQILRCPTVLTVRTAQHKGGFQNNSHFLPRNFIYP
jgi:hypothetical protein